jgi:hypothetical protein
VNEMKHEFISDPDYEQCHAQWRVPISSLRFDRPMVCLVGRASADVAVAMTGVRPSRLNCHQRNDNPCVS